MFIRIASCFLLLTVVACNTPKKMGTPSISSTSSTSARQNILDSILRKNPLFLNIIKQKEALNVQVIYTRIDRDAANHPTFTDFRFNVDNDRYFYPASTVKMPVALLALEKLNALRIDGLTRRSSMVTDSNFSRQQNVLIDPRTGDSRPSIEQYIKEIFVVSDNEAFNRLYEYVGQHEINERLHTKGFTQAEILHRLSVTMSEEENRHTNAVSFYDTSGNLLYQQAPAYNSKRYNKRNTTIGKGYYRDDELIKEPFNFSMKNRFNLDDLHRILRSLLFPETVPEKQRFNLTADDYRFVYKAMSTLPAESNYPAYDTANYWDAYVKFLLYGSAKEAMPGNVRIFNKVGDAYGFLTDVAYIVDFDNKIEFMVSATLLCNSDGIFNDDHYDYDEVGFPFMKNLGQALYQYELTRERTHKPDLSKFVFNYKEEDVP